MRVVLDTNVVVSGFLWGGVPRQLLQAAREKRLQLFTSTTLPLELTDILGRVKFVHKLAAAQLSIDQLVERYALLATVVHPATITPPSSMIPTTITCWRAPWPRRLISSSREIDICSISRNTRAFGL